MRPELAVLLAAGLVLASPALADEVTDQLDQARRYYQDGDLPEAVAELEFALQAMKGQIGRQLLATFPEPPPGWTAEAPAEAQQGSIPFLGAGAAMLGRTYRADAGDASIEAQLMSGGGFLQSLAGMVMNPQVLAAQPNAKRVRIGRDNAVMTYDPEDRTAQLVLDVGGKATIMLQGRNLAGGEPLVALATRWDLKKVRELVGA
jgi:hypothetical protein